MWYHCPMGISKSKLNSYLNDFETGVTELSSKEVDFGNTDEIDLIISLYDEISSFLIDTKGIPDVVRKYIISKKDEKLPDEYSALYSVNRLYEVIKQSAKKQINFFMSEKNYPKAIEIFSKVLRFDVRNIELTEYIEPVFKDNGLTKELVDLYKLEFVYTLDPLCFEKAGDIYYEANDFNSAIDSYLNCAEISENYLQIYEKLADVFGKINDETSKNACLEQIKRIKDGL